MANADITTYINAIPETTITEYTKYWTKITPLTDEEYYRRWLFAFLSVHTTWKANVKAYVQIEKDSQPTDKQKLQQMITLSKVGLIKMRTDGMWKFKNDFWRDPKLWRKRADETWDAFRDRTMNMCHGIGYAKTAFAIELCYPNECEITCLDTHMLQLYGYDGKGVPCGSKYKVMEKHWVDACKAKGFPAFMTRNVYWDKVQKQNDTRYWSYVFEQPEPAKQDKVPTTGTALPQPVELANTIPAKA